jgi:hypothetical protein
MGTGVAGPHLGMRSGNGREVSRVLLGLTLGALTRLVGRVLVRVERARAVPGAVEELPLGAGVALVLDVAAWETT